MSTDEGVHGRCACGWSVHTSCATHGTLEELWCCCTSCQHVVVIAVKPGTRQRPACEACGGRTVDWDPYGHCPRCRKRVELHPILGYA